MKTILIHIIIRLLKGKYYSISGNTETLMKVAKIAEKFGYRLHMPYSSKDTHILFYPDLLCGFYPFRGSKLTFKL